MKRLFYKVQRLAHRKHEAKAELDKKITDKWGVHYSDFDLDQIIDTLDYGTGVMTYEQFVNEMDGIKKDVSL